LTEGLLPGHLPKTQVFHNPKYSDDRPVCVHPVTVFTQQYAYRRDKHPDLDMRQCTVKSRFLIDGRPYCTNHARSQALAWLMQMEGNGEEVGD